MKICIISQQGFSNLHVSADTIGAFEEALLSFDNVQRAYLSEMRFRINRKLGKKLKIRNGIIDWKVIREVRKVSPDYLLSIAMGPDDLLYQANTLSKIGIPKAVYCIDTWQSKIDLWKRAISMANVQTVFLAYKASQSTFQGFVSNVFFLPYSMNQKWFFPRKGLSKSHLFMQMGRRNVNLHQYALKYIEEKGLQDNDYIREKKRGQIIYPEFNQLAEEINKTFFFLLAPRNVDESNITGEISDVTARFYEGMACNALLVGYKPKDTFDELFPYNNAMIEVSGYEDFRDKIDYYLTHVEDYYRITEKNYKYIMEHHTWKHRAEQLIRSLQSI